MENQENQVVENFITNVKADQELLKEVDEKMKKIKEERTEVLDRMKVHKMDMSSLIKYANDSQVEDLKELGFETTNSSQGINAIASLAFDIILKAKDYQLTNLEHYEEYKATFKNPDDAFSYTEFNIKCRSLFNTQKLIRIKGVDAKSSKDDIIKLNGSLIKKEEKQEDTTEPVLEVVDPKSSKKDIVPVVENKEKANTKEQQKSASKKQSKK